MSVPLIINRTADNNSQIRQALPPQRPIWLLVGIQTNEGLCQSIFIRPMLSTQIRSKRSAAAIPT